MPVTGICAEQRVYGAMFPALEIWPERPRGGEVKHIFFVPVKYARLRAFTHISINLSELHPQKCCGPFSLT